jgi:hypothetical protein
MENTDTRIKNISTDGDGTSVTVRDGARWARHFSVRRGGCLHLGEIELVELGTGRRKSISSSSIADGTPSHVAYLFSLWERHLGAASA